MEKTVLVVVGNGFSSLPCGQGISLELSQGGKGNKGAHVKCIPRSVWTCSVEAVSEYCRVILDLFPEQYQVCVAAVDETKCQPINSWRDEDQDISKVLSGFQTFGYPVFQPVQGGNRGPSHLNPCMQGLQYAVRCLAQLTATQYATTISHQEEKPLNRGRIIFVCSLKNDSDVKELEKAIVNLVKGENADIKQKQDMARLHIHHCQLVLVNTYSLAGTITCTIKDSPLTELSSAVSSVVYSFPATLLLEKSMHLAKMHFDLKSTMITGIPMKEEQAGGSSANYDVELIHLSEAHRDILRAGYALGPNPTTKKDSTQPKDVITLRWSTPKSTSMDLQFCTSAYRVTPSNVTSRPTICLINFVLSGKSVLLEQSRKGPAKVISHILYNHGGALFLHCIPTSRPYLDDPPSISEGWGGRITDYRISDLSELVLENLLCPLPVDRTKIPTVYPIHKAIAKLEHDTRYWPLVYTDTILYTIKQELEPLPDLVKHPVLSDMELEQCRNVILDLQAREAANEALAIPSTGGRNKGIKRDEQYRTLWGEIETLTQAYSNTSERHRSLCDFVVKVIASSPSVQQARKAGLKQPDSSTLTSAPPSSSPMPTGYNAAETSWRDLDRYQLMGERESSYTDNPSKWQHQQTTPYSSSSVKPSSLLVDSGLPPPSLPVPAKSTGSLLSLWTAKEKNKANSGHVEFAGRTYGEVKAELYPHTRTVSNMMPPLTQE